jgi:hypothetical protein
MTVAIDIVRTRDRAKIFSDELAKIVQKHVEETTGRQVHSVEFHAGRNELGAVTIHFEFKD